MRRSVLLPAAVALAMAAAALLPPGEADAIPAFARKYRFSCSTCHAPFPRLKPNGEEFAARGFRLPPGEEPARTTFDTGDPLLDLPRDFPIAARLEGFAAWHEDGPVNSEFENPWVFKALSGGPISKKVSYYLYYILEKNEAENLEDAYLQINTPLGAPFNVIFGQFQVSDPLFKRELRLERSDYEIYRVAVGGSSVDLTYDRGLMVLGTAPGGLDLVFEVVNGNGIPKGEFDNDDNKNLALRLSKDLGVLRLGAFAYWGREEALTGVTNETTYVGPDLTWRPNESWELNLQYLQREDDDPDFSLALGGGPPPRDVTTRGGFAELHWFPTGPDGRWVASLLYNDIQSDYRYVDYSAQSLTVNYLLARNVRLLTEVGRESFDDPAFADVDHDFFNFSLGLVAAF